jgi:3-oxoacyl-[acyl-carrier protein] reductase
MPKTAVITGASRGIGKACAELFLSKGFAVVGTYLNTPESELADGVDFIKADVSKSADVENLAAYVERNYGGADILINNAGIADQKLFTDITEHDWDSMMDINAKSVYLCCKAFLPYMINWKSGAIVNISSVWGITGASCEVHYSASKAAVIGLTKALAKETAPSGVRVNAIAPGVIDTDMNRKLSPSDIADIMSDTPLCRLGTPEDIARAVYFLCSGEASFITGQVLTVDGGFIG